jgi:hypothetical protein
MRSCGRTALAAHVAKSRRTTAYHRGDCVLEDQLFLRIVLEQNRIFVEGTYLARQLYAADQVDGNGAFVLADRIQERMLKNHLLTFRSKQSRSNLAAKQTCTIHPIAFDASVQGHRTRKDPPRLPNSYDNKDA